MDWWQIILIVLLSIVAGVFVGGLFSYLIIRLPRKLKERRETPPAVKEQVVTPAPAVVEEPPKSTAPEPAAEAEGKRVSRLSKKVEEEREAPAVAEEQIVEEQVVAPTPRVVEEPPKSVAPELLAEVENNRKIATEPWADKLLAFQTGVWDTSTDSVHTLPAHIREELTQAYADMRLANSIVWLSTELGRRSPNLDENYMKLCTSIAARLNKAVPLLNEPGS